MKLLTSLKRLKLNTGKHSSPVLEQRINKVDVSVFVVKGAISPALTLVSIRSSRLPITLEASPVADSIGLSTRSVRRTLTSDVIIFLVNALITSRLDYCNSVLVLTYDVHLRQLQDVHAQRCGEIDSSKTKYGTIVSRQQEPYVTSPTGCQSGNMLTLKYLCLSSTASLTS